MIKFRCFTQILTLQTTFRTAHGSREQIESLWVELSDNGLQAYGEAVPVPYYGHTAQELKKVLDALQNTIEQTEINNASAFWEKMHPYLSDLPAAQCALDIAVYDYLSQKAQKPLYRYLGLAWREDLPVSNYTISLGTAEQMLAQMQATPYPIYKIKLGSENDLEILKALQECSPATFRIDANCAWTLEQAKSYLPELEKMQIEFIEQPFAVGEWQAVEELRKITSIPGYILSSGRTNFT